MSLVRLHPSTHQMTAVGEPMVGPESSFCVSFQKVLFELLFILCETWNGLFVLLGDLFTLEGA